MSQKGLWYVVRMNSNRVNKFIDVESNSMLKASKTIRIINVEFLSIEQHALHYYSLHQ